MFRPRWGKHHCADGGEFKPRLSSTQRASRTAKHRSAETASTVAASQPPTFRPPDVGCTGWLFRAFFVRCGRAPTCNCPMGWNFNGGVLVSAELEAHIALQLLLPRLQNPTSIRRDLKTFHKDRWKRWQTTLFHTPRL